MGRYPDGLPFWYRPDGTPIASDDEMQDLIEWGELKRLYMRVAETTIGNYWVSTVYLGHDHNFFSPGNPPIIFETMVFNQDGGIAEYNDEYMDRYATWEQALQGHQNVVGAIEAIEGVQGVTHLGQRPGS